MPILLCVEKYLNVYSAYDMKDIFCRFGRHRANLRDSNFANCVLSDYLIQSNK